MHRDDRRTMQRRTLCRQIGRADERRRDGFCRRAGIIDRTLLNARCAARLGLIRSYLQRGIMLPRYIREMRRCNINASHEIFVAILPFISLARSVHYTGGWLQRGRRATGQTGARREDRRRTWEDAKGGGSFRGNREEGGHERDSERIGWWLGRQCWSSARVEDGARGRGGWKRGW